MTEQQIAAAQAEAWDEEEGGMSEHGTCADTLRRLANSKDNPMHGLRGSMVVAAQRPAITVPEFPPVAMICPHGVRLWTYPDGPRVAALRDLNYPAPTTAGEGERGEG